MIFNRHSNLEGKHAFLSASKYHWINYDEQKLIDTYSNYRAAQKGTELHDFAKRCIQLGIKLPDERKTLNMYVNDAIRFGLVPEQPLYFSENCFGTADTIGFKNNILRISDLKTGVSTASMDQLMIYESIFCLEYGLRPTEFESELRIYQSDDIQMLSPEPEDIFMIMGKIVKFDLCIQKLKEGDSNEFI